MRLGIFPFGLALALGSVAQADFEPILLAPGSFNQDIVVESNAPPPAGRATTASMDAGTNNTGNSWYEIGFNPVAPMSGVPAAGSTFTHENLGDHQYAMAPSYTGPNAILIAPNQVITGSLTLSAPATYGNLSVLASGGNGGVSVNYTIHYADATTQTGSLMVGDWFGGANQAWTANGRANVNTFSFDSVNSGNPRLYGYDIALANTGSAVTSIDLSYASGTGRAAFLALSGAPAAGGNWSPIAVTGYNYDMIIEATAPPGGPLRTATTASMDGGTNNTGSTWFERGYDPFTPLAGLPAAGSVVTSVSLPDHHYLMPESYAANNVALVDSNSPTANLTLATPDVYSALSFLSATAHGNVTNLCIMQYEDGTSETNTFVSRDWFNNTPVAYTANGRVNLDDRSLNSVNGNNPRLYEAQFVLGNTASPLTNIVLVWVGGAGDSRAVVFAVSGTAGTVPPIISAHPQSVGTYQGSNVIFSVGLAGGTPPLSFQWQVGTNGTFGDVMDGPNIHGATTSNLTINGVNLQNAGSYRVVVSNAGGTVTSAAATLTVLASLPDVTAPGDAITSFGGMAPTNESVDHAIDNLTDKYLNFGSGPNANQPPFVGPVGLLVTPAKGSTRVTGLRFYTANDAPERDPADYILEGSNDGGATYTLISSNALSLPEGRNASGQALNPLTHFVQEVTFENENLYTSYRLTFTRVKNATAANSMQIAEVELLGSNLAVLSIRHEPDGTVTVSSSIPGNLQATTELRGAETTWDDYGPVSSGAGAQNFPTSMAEKLFFRVVVP